MQASHHDWQTLSPLNNLALLHDEVHVWRASLNVSSTSIQRLQQTLSPDEVERANRFHFERDHNHFIVARGILRAILGRYLNESPSKLRFRYNSYGKPALASSSASPSTSLHFNISHSHELALFAFTYNRELGVDVEYMSNTIEYDELARHTFSPDEAAVVAGLSNEEKRQGFFNCWTRKEAYIKARGMGVSLDLTSFDVSLKPGEPAALLHSREDLREVTRWQFEALHVEEGYASALAVEGHEWRLRTWQW